MGNIGWCSCCYTIYDQNAGHCVFCGDPLVDLDKMAIANQGEWRVFCCQGRMATPAQHQQILGRDDPFTGFLFFRNTFISRQHVMVEARPLAITVTDLQSPNGTFVEAKAPENQDSEHWRRLSSGQESTLATGDWLLLSKECLCRLWLKWVPASLPRRAMMSTRKAQKAIDLPQSGSLLLRQCQIACQDDRHILENMALQADFAIAVNGKEIVKALLQKGDRVILAGDEYEYSPQRLLPAHPLPAIAIRIAHAVIPGRLRIERLEINHGQFVGIVGASGSGKSTLIKSLTGWLTPTAGEMKIQIGEQNADIDNLKSTTAYVPQYDIVYDNLTVQSCLFYSGLLKLAPEEFLGLSERIGQILSQVGLSDCGKKRIRELSGGQRRRINIANALVSEEPSLLVLDEPTSGLDLANDYKIMQMLQRLCRQGRTVICTTHHLSNMELLDQVILLKDGAIKSSGTPAEIASSIRCALGETDWRHFYLERECQDNGRERSASVSPPIPVIAGPKFVVLLCRRIEEFLHPKGLWTNLLSMLLLIPFWIGFAVYLAWPIANGEEKRFFLCAVAAFWLAMSFSSQELCQKRYRIFLHEKAAGIPVSSFTLSYFVFYSLVSLVQTILLVLPSLWIMQFPAIWLFGGLTWAMGICGAIVGLNLSFCESRWKIPTPVTVPCITVMQLLFSELVMGLVLGGASYFKLKPTKAQDAFYLLTFSRYPDMAYRAYHNSLEGIPNEFYCNIGVFVILGLVLPAVIFLVIINNKADLMER